MFYVCVCLGPAIILLSPGTQKGEQERLNWPSHYRSKPTILTTDLEPVAVTPFLGIFSIKKIIISQLLFCRTEGFIGRWCSAFASTAEFYNFMHFGLSLIPKLLVKGGGRYCLGMRLFI